MRGTTIAILVLALIGATGHLWRNGDLPDLGALAGAFAPEALLPGGSGPEARDSEAVAEAADAAGAAGERSAGAKAGSADGDRGGRAVPGSERDSAAGSGDTASAGTPGKSIYYQWVDDQGSVHFARSLDEVPADWRGRVGRFEVDAAAPAPGATAKPPTKLASAGSAAAKRARAARHAAKPRGVQTVAAVESPFSRNHDVTVYTAPWCGWCRKTMAFLDERGVVYENKDIESDPAYEDELREKTGETSIPFVEIDDAEIHGFNPVEMTRLLID